MQADGPTSQRVENSDRVEVVADQTADGAYEIRVERHAPGATPTRLTAPPPTRHDAARGRRVPSWLVIAGLTAVSMTLAIGAFLAARPAPAPPTIDARPVTTFRAFRVEPIATIAPTDAPDAGVTEDLGSAGAAPAISFGAYNAIYPRAEGMSPGSGQELDSFLEERLQQVAVSADPVVVPEPAGAAAASGATGLDEEGVDEEELEEGEVDEEELEEGEVDEEGDLDDPE